MKRTVAISLVLLSPEFLVSQVTIKERVQISPHAIQSQLSTQAATTLRMECSFTGPVDNNEPRLLYIIGPCGNSAGLSSINGSISVQAYGGGYRFGYRFNVPRSGGGGLFQLALYLGNDAIYQVGFPVNCPTGCRLTTDQPLWLYSGFTLSGSDEIWYGDANRFGAASFSSPTPCLTSVWHPEVPITLEITSGSELGSFVDNAGNDLGKTVTKKASEFNTFSYLANGDPPQGSEGTVVITATSANIVLEKSFKVKRRGPDHFAITLEHDEIAFTETSKIFVQAKDASDQDVVFDDNEKLFFTVIENGQYGTFINKSGDTVKTAPPTLGDVTYADARSGQIRFAAVKKNPAVREVAKIRVAWQGDETKKGETEIAVLEQTLKIVLFGPREIWPILPPADPEHPHADNRTLLEIQMTRGSEPVAAHPFKLWTAYVDRSGAHDHDEQQARTGRPEGDFACNGHFVSAQTTPNTRANPMEESTQPNGRASYEYVASIFGDRMLLKVESTRNSLLWDTLSLAERVPDLELLPERVYYEKVGGRCNHYGPRNDTKYQGCRTPDNNHWGAPLTLRGIDSIAAIYHREFPEDPILWINDISLPMGGRFDIYGQWAGNAYHQYHRFGKDVDVDRTSMPAENEEEFVRVCLDNGVIDPDPEDEAHYHLYFWNAG